MRPPLPRPLSNSCTRRPAAVRAVAADRPAMPLPMMAMGVFMTSPRYRDYRLILGLNLYNMLILYRMDLSNPAMNPDASQATLPGR
ncbi:hypothetical protein D3C81_1587450 [compost metagenome]